MKESVIVSLTTHPPRIDTVHMTIDSLLNQTVEPQLIVLWLAESQFPDKELPESLVNLLSDRLKVRWCPDYKSYKKLLPALEEFPSSTIITTDDDVIYEKDMVEKLLCWHEAYPNVILCHRSTRAYIDARGLRLDPGGTRWYSEPSYVCKVTGVGGCLYPVGALHRDALDPDLAMRLCPTNDDVWFWLQGVRNGTPSLQIADGHIHIRQIAGTSESALSRKNDGNQGLLWQDLQRVLDAYPELYGEIAESYARVRGLMRERLPLPKSTPKRQLVKIPFIESLILRKGRKRAAEALLLRPYIPMKGGTHDANPPETAP